MAWFKRVLKRFIRLLKRLLHLVSPWLKSLPWKKIGIVVGLVLLFIWSLLQFYLATPSRMIRSFNENLLTYEEISLEMEKINTTARSLNNESLADFQNSMNIMVDNIKNKHASLPPRFLSWYAFLTSPNSLKEQLTRLYGQNKFDIGVIKENASTSHETARLSKELLEKGENAIYSDTDGYVAFLEQSSKILDNLDESDKVSIEVPRKIFSFIYLAAKDYQATGNKENFSQRYSNLSSELAEETGLSWINSTKEQQNNITTQIQTLKAIINMLEN